MGSCNFSNEENRKDHVIILMRLGNGEWYVKNGGDFGRWVGFEENKLIFLIRNKAKIEMNKFKLV